MPCTTCGNLGPQHYPDPRGEGCLHASPGGVTGPFGCPKPTTPGWFGFGGKKSRKSKKSKKSKKSRKSRK